MSTIHYFLNVVYCVMYNNHALKYFYAVSKTEFLNVLFFSKKLRIQVSILYVTLDYLVVNIS